MMEQFSYQKFMDRIDLPEEAQSLFWQYRERAEQAEYTGMLSPALALADCIVKSRTAYEKYRERGISDSIFYDTMSDITIWAKVCHRDYGVWGLREYGWLQNHLQATLFRLGRLQFELKPFPYEVFTDGENIVRRGDKVVNIHIPEGEPLTKAARLDSYRQARRFFGLHVFVCDSWLLYPAHEAFLPPDSNIVDFMHDFTIIDSEEHTGFDNMWRIFGRRDAYEPSKLPRDTGLRRAYADWLARHGTVGSGYGVLFFTETMEAQ